METFEAWNNNFGSLIFEFDDPYVQRKFLKMPHAWIERHFGGIPTARVLLVRWPCAEVEISCHPGVFAF